MFGILRHSLSRGKEPLDKLSINAYVILLWTSVTALREHFLLAPLINGCLIVAQQFAEDLIVVNA